MKRYVNTSGRDLLIYADSDLSTPTGTLYRDSAGYCILERDATIVVLYKVASNGVFKVGFTNYVQGIREA